MGVVFRDHCEAGNLNFWTTYQTGLAINALYSRDGNYSWYFSVAGKVATRDFDAVSEGYLRVPILVPGLPTSETPFAYLLKDGTEVAKLSVTTGMQVKVESNSLTATGDKVLQVENWYVVELHFKLDASVGVAEVRIDGDDDASIGPADLVDVETDFNQFRIKEGIRWCDQGLNDTTGTDNTSWCGDGRILFLSPETDVQASWSPFVGASSWSEVDEVPKDDNTTYVSATTAGTKDLLTCASIDIGDGSVNLVWGYTQSAKALAEDTEELKTLLKAGSTEVGASAPALTTAYQPGITTYYASNPDTSVPWTEADVNASLQVGYEVL